MIFKDPWVLLLIPIFLIVVFIFHRKRKDPTVRFPSTALAEGVGSSWKMRLRRFPDALRYVVLILFLVSLAGPRLADKEVIRTAEGIDIVLAIDVSRSMAAEDFVLEGERVNRLAVVLDVVKDFIENREADRISLVVFARRAYTVAPLTTDYDWLKFSLRRVELGIVDGRATAIGSALATSVSRLKESEAESKVVVLLTDGVNNAGEIDPLAAAKAAEALGIKIYTIGAGTRGYAPYPARDIFGRTVYTRQLTQIDEEMLKEVADLTRGKYYRATDTESLKGIYQEIDRFEKTEIEETGYVEYEELFHYFLIAALIFLAIEIFLRETVFFQIP